MYIFKLLLTDLKAGNKDCSTLISKKLTIFLQNINLKDFPSLSVISLYILVILAKRNTTL